MTYLDCDDSSSLSVAMDVAGFRGTKGQRFNARGPRAGKLSGSHKPRETQSCDQSQHSQSRLRRRVRESVTSRAQCTAIFENTLITTTPAMMSAMPIIAENM